MTCDAQRGVDGDAGGMHGEAEAVARSKLTSIDVRDCTAIGPKEGSGHAQHAAAQLQCFVFAGKELHGALMSFR